MQKCEYINDPQCFSKAVRLVSRWQFHTSEGLGSITSHHINHSLVHFSITITKRSSYRQVMNKQMNNQSTIYISTQATYNSAGEEVRL